MQPEMPLDTLAILRWCALGGVVLLVAGFWSLQIGARKAKSEFRIKGYLKTPAGKRWFPFLLYKQYDAFDNPSTRFFFGISHMCLMALIFVMAAVVILLSSEFLLGSVARG